uniref:thioredoxin family protein n=1 Tax=Gelidibacter sp. TaxID=2018083 RepID=UPI00404A6C36
MKTITLTFILMLCITLSSAQKLNTEIANEGETPFLLGKIDKAGLSSENYKSWFDKNYKDYQLDQTTIDELSKTLKNYTIKVFLGTWCGDSKREVPNFYKVLEACQFPDSQLEVIALSNKPDMYKQSPNHEEQGLNIHRVPTFIIYKNGVEVNRIVEYPVESLEKDLLNIITNNTYVPNYIIVKKVDEQLKNGTFKASKKASKELKPHSKKLAELNTYSYILLTTNRQNEAIEILKLNTLLFPKDAKAFEFLANSYYSINQPKKALKNYKKALKLAPDDQNLKSYITALENN